MMFPHKNEFQMEDFVRNLGTKQRVCSGVARGVVIRMTS